MASTITDARRSRGPYIAVCWNTDIPLLAEGTPQQYICLHSLFTFFTRRSHPATSPRTPSFGCPPYRQQAKTCLLVRKRATRGRLSSSTRPNIDAHDTWRARWRSRDSRPGESPVASSGDETEDEPPYEHPDLPTQRVVSPVRVENKTNQPSPDSGGVSMPALESPGGATPAAPPALDRAPPSPPGLSALSRTPSPGLPGPGSPCRPLGRGIFSSAGPSGRSTTPTR